MRNLRFIECTRTEGKNEGARILINIDSIETVFPLDTGKTRICFSNGYVDVNETYERIIPMIEYCEEN